MRAVCESCARPQPVDWQAGDRCIHCGLAVRAEARCYWCLKWQPAGKFCRSCGAASIGAAQFGAARMLKHQGASVFEIPKLLVEFDEDRIAVYQSMYQQQYAVASRHVGDAEWLEQFLFLKHWSEELDEQLIQEMPWDERRLREMSAACRGDRLLWLSQLSPAPRVRELATMARLYTGDRKVYNDVSALVGSDLNDEAILQLTNWHCLYFVEGKTPKHRIVEVLRNHPSEAHAGPRLAWYGEPADLSKTTNNEETEFLRAIMEKRHGSLRLALEDRSAEKRFVAAWELCRLGRTHEMADTLATLPEELLRNLVRNLCLLKKPVPDLHRSLLALGDGPARKDIAALFGLGATAEDAVALLRLDPFDPQAIHGLLAGKLEPAVLDEIGRYLVFNGRFQAEDYGWGMAAKPGRLPEDFVERLFPHTGADAQEQLVRLAEKQLGERGEQRNPIARFVVRTAFATIHPNVREAAWSALRRNRLHNEFLRINPFPLTPENVAWCWDMREFLTALRTLLRKARDVRDLRDDLEGFLHSATPEFFQAAAREQDLASDIHAYLAHEWGRMYPSAFEIGLAERLR